MNLGATHRPFAIQAKARKQDAFPQADRLGAAIGLIDAALFSALIWSMIAVFLH